MSTTLRVEVGVEGGLRSLSWAGEDLIDWIGGKRISLDGSVSRFGCGYSYRFDGATGLEDVGVMVETLGTKGRLVRWNGQLVQNSWVPIGFDQLRELDRSYYQATAYSYPVAVLRLPDGRTAIAHCPRRYDTLELELLDGTPLTPRPDAAEDVFHSRLAASPDGRWLLSNGWIWHPRSVACVYDVARALIEPAHLSSIGLDLELGDERAYEVQGAVLSADRVVVSAVDEDEERAFLSVVALPSGKNLGCIPLAEGLGTQLVAWGPEHVVAIDGTPRVVSLESGEVVETLEVGVEIGGRMEPSGGLAEGPHVAIDPLGGRFAIGGADGRIRVFTRAR